MPHVFSYIRFAVFVVILLNKMPVSLSESPIIIHAYVIQSLTKIIIQNEFMQYPFVCLFTVEFMMDSRYFLQKPTLYYANIYFTYPIHCNAFHVNLF